MLRCVVLAWAVGGSLVWAQFSPPVCTAQAGNIPTIRSEGVAELVGGVLIECTGGTPTPPGLPTPDINVQIFLNTNVTSRLTSSNLSEALLFLDDPSTPVVGTDVFQGQLQGVNGIVFDSVPFNPTGTPTPRTLLLRNIRVNANQLPPASQIILRVFLNDASGTPIPVTNSELAVATTAPGADFIAFAGSATSASATQGLFMELRFTEGFSNALKARDLGANGTLGGPPSPQTGPQPPSTETGYYNPSILPQVPPADTGTLLYIFVTNIPPAMQLSFPGTNEPGSGDIFRLVSNCTGTGVPVQVGSTNYVTATAVNGSVLACYEAAQVSAGQTTVRFRINENYPNNAPLQTTQLLQVQGGLGPFPALANHLKQASLPVPRFGSYGDSSSGLLKIRSNANNMPWPFLAAGEIRQIQAAGEGLGIILDESVGVSFNGYSWINVSWVRSGATRADGLTVSQTANPTPESLNFLPVRAGTTNWLTATLSQTSAPATVSLAVDPTGLAPGTYRGSVTVASTTAGAGSATVPVTLRVPPANQPEIKSFGYGIANAASYRSNVVAPGEAVVIFGFHFGPPQIATLRLTNNVADTLLAGTRILFDGVPGPMIYAVDGVVSCFVPFSVAGKTYVDVEVEYNGLKSLPVRVPVAEAAPGLLTANASGGGQGAILNADFTLNADTGSLPGDVVVLYGSGGGVTVPAAQDGHINAGGALAASVRRVFVDGVEVPFEYFGPAPGQIEGVFQVNLRLPANVRRNANLPVMVQIGDFVSQPGVTIRVR